jgi:hypothetical protein
MILVLAIVATTGASALPAVSRAVTNPDGTFQVSGRNGDRGDRNNSDQQFSREQRYGEIFRKQIRRRI